MYDKGEQRYEDELIADVLSETFDEQLLARFRERIGMEGETERTLISRYLARKDKDERAKVTRAGILLFHTTPALHFPTSDLRFIRYAGTAIATGIRQNITADQRYEGPLPRIVEAVFRDISAILRQITRLNPATSTFETEPEYPLFAWQEAIVNAVTHRAYNISGQRIEIRLFDNRLEVESPGKLPGLVRVENMRDVHFLRIWWTPLSRQWNESFLRAGCGKIRNRLRTTMYLPRTGSGLRKTGASTCLVPYMAEMSLYERGSARIRRRDCGRNAGRQRD